MNHRDTEAQRGKIPDELNRVTGQIVDAVFAVHKQLGPGLTEYVYQVCLLHEMRQRGLKVEHEVKLPIRYGDIVLESALRLDVVVENSVVLELKAVEELTKVHSAQLLTYLKLSGYRIGLLINFNTAMIKDGIRRIVL